MGTVWKVVIYKALSYTEKEVLGKEIERRLEEFDSLYSRFKEDSLVSGLAKTTGVILVPHDLVVILRIYKQFYKVSQRKFTPCIGSLLEDLGYDKDYSLVAKSTTRDVPDFETAVTIIDDTHIELHRKVLLDIGAVGKGYAVDLIVHYLQESGYERFLVDGSGDVYYEGNGIPIEVGLEHPRDTSKVIGVMEMKKGAMCSSATNRRSWGKYSHYVDPISKDSPDTIIATWVMAESAALSDALSTLFFFISPEEVRDLDFSYCIMNHEDKIKKSPDFLATFF